MKKDAIDKIIKSQIDNGLIHPYDGAKKEGFKMGLLYALNQGQELPIDNISECMESECNSKRYWHFIYCEHHARRKELI